MAIGVGLGVYPALSAARLDPIACLQTESTDRMTSQRSAFGMPLATSLVNDQYNL